MENNYSFEYKIVKPAEEYALQYTNNSVLLVNKYLGEQEFRHYLVNNPLGMYIDGGVILLGKLYLQPPCHTYSFYISGATIHIADDNLLHISTRKNNGSHTASIALSRTPVLCSISNKSFIVQL